MSNRQALGPVQIGAMTEQSVNEALRTLADRVDPGLVVTAVRTAYSVSSTDDLVTVDATAAPLTVRLPKAAGLRGHVVNIKRLNGGSNAVTIAAAATERIDGSGSFALSVQYECLTLVSDGTNWLIV